LRDTRGATARRTRDSERLKRLINIRKSSFRVITEIPSLELWGKACQPSFSPIFSYHGIGYTKIKRRERESAKIWKKKKRHRIGEEKITGKIRAIYI
jgi:hypothetical protein